VEAAIGNPSKLMETAVGKAMSKIKKYAKTESVPRCLIKK
jgi:hypothetical protein